MSRARDTILGRGISSTKPLNTHICPGSSHTHSNPEQVRCALKGKGKVHPGTGHEGPEGTRGIALLFL